MHLFVPCTALPANPFWPGTAFAVAALLVPIHMPTVAAVGSLHSRVLRVSAPCAAAVVALYFVFLLLPVGLESAHDKFMFVSLLYSLNIGLSFLHVRPFNLCS